MRPETGNWIYRKGAFTVSAGTLVHDHETALYHFGTDHAECNVHIIRYLRKNTEETGNRWSGEMISLLGRMNKQRKGLMAQGSGAMPAEMATDNVLLHHGHNRNPEKTKHGND